MSNRSPKTIIVVGGGASGTLVAAHLLRARRRDVRVVLIEKGNQLGRGIAYSTRDDHHLLNVCAANMSAFADDPGHFVRWLSCHGLMSDTENGAFWFAPRRIYGQYLEELLSSGGEALAIVKGEAVQANFRDGGVEIVIKDGSVHFCDAVVLACGHDCPEKTEPFLNPWDRDEISRMPIYAHVLIIGTGLTMVDTTISLVNSGHLGPITAISRRGLIPHIHKKEHLISIAAADLPIGSRAAGTCRWLRQFASRYENKGGDWRDVVDGLRPHTQHLWQTMPMSARKTFLRHGRPWWDVHRHRMAPEIGAKIHSLIREGRLRILAGKVNEVIAGSEVTRVKIHRRGSCTNETLDVSAVISCTGVTSRLDTLSNPLAANLVSQKRMRADAFGISIDVDEHGAVKDHDGHSSDRLFAIGPMSQGRFWEVIAVPDIRQQASDLARFLTATALKA